MCVKSSQKAVCLAVVLWQQTNSKGGVTAKDGVGRLLSKCFFSHHGGFL